LTMVPFPQAASWVSPLTFSAVMGISGRGTGVPASTAGIAVGVAVGGMDVGRGANVGAGVVGVGAQAVNKNRNKRIKQTRLFIIYFLSQEKNE
jgi:hypothetical protein